MLIEKDVSVVCTVNENNASSQKYKPRAQSDVRDKMAIREGERNWKNKKNRN
jgi:hypothetical protein